MSGVSPPHQPPSAAPLLVRRMLEPHAYPHPTKDIHLIETHISWVFLTGDFVYKVKKPCDLGFLDFSTLARRREMCHEEVRLNRRFAPDLYLGAVPITGSPAAPRVDGTGEPIEWAVKLRQFDEGSRLDRLFAEGRLSADDCGRLGAEIARVEEGLAVADPKHRWGSANAFLGIVTMNLDQLRAARPDATARADALQTWLTHQCAALGLVIEQRMAAGRIRECHGDLHLANLVLHEGRMMAFDGIEFNDSLRWIDVASDVAFLAMDLRARGRPDLAAHVVSSWMETADDHHAAHVLPLYMVYRAIVRAAVAAIRLSQVSQSDDQAGMAASRAESDRYLDLAERLIAPRRPTLFVTSGVSGSGKTTIATRIIGTCYAVRLRSDVERKRLAGMAATDRPLDAAHRGALYGPQTTLRVYERLAALTRTLLAAGSSVVVDAACNTRAQRQMLSAVAQQTSTTLVWLEFDIPEADLIARVAARQAANTDASDASVEIVHGQIAAREPIAADELAETPGARLVRVTAAELADPAFMTRDLEGGTP